MAEALLAMERRVGDDGKACPVRQRPLAEYVASARRMRDLMRKTGCEAAMAAEVEQGKTDAAFVVAYMRQRNWFENPRRRDGVGPADPVAPRRRPVPRGARAGARRSDGPVPHA